MKSSIDDFGQIIAPLFYLTLDVNVNTTTWKYKYIMTERVDDVLKVYKKMSLKI